MDKKLGVGVFRNADAPPPQVFRGADSAVSPRNEARVSRRLMEHRQDAQFLTGESLVNDRRLVNSGQIRLPLNDGSQGIPVDRGGYPAS